MASENAFNKRLTAETTVDKVEGILEHFNLPPKAISFVRANYNTIKIVLIILVIAVVSASLYRSYRKQVVEDASSGLAAAMQQTGAEQITALEKVAKEYSSTSSAMWARVELAHLDMKNGNYSDAVEKYRKVLADLNTSNPLYPLVLFSVAQSLEAEKKYTDAEGQYDALKNFKGFEQLAYSGIGRIEEMQGNIDKAIAIYNDFLLSIGDDPSFAQAKEEIEKKIVRLKARK